MSRSERSIFWVLLGVGILLRCVALDSDPYPSLSWSSALLTDEGFYLHNARNLLLFGQERLDEFNPYLITPLLHTVQVVIFRLLGVGLVSARLISVVCSLFTLGLFFFSIRRAFGERVAALATLFLALDPVFLLYNRMALMDTPACLPMVGAFYAFLRGNEVEARHRAFWLALCGFLCVVAYSVRGLALLVLLAPLIALWLGGREARRRILAFGVGFCLPAALFIVVWWLPHRAELSAMNAFYLRQQLLPHSAAHFAQIVGRAVFGDERGIGSFLFRHSPVLTVLALLGLFSKQMAVGSDRQQTALRYLRVWLATGWLVFALVGYSPSRYYVLFYPAMAAIASLALTHLSALWREVLGKRWACVVLTAFGSYHLVLALFSVNVVWLVLSVFVGGALGYVAVSDGERLLAKVTPRHIAMAWLLVSMAGLAHWLGTIGYTQRTAEEWIKANIPAKSVLIGDAASGIAVSSSLQIVPVIPKLCNDRDPLSQFSEHPLYVCILDGEFVEKWWKERYPHLIHSRNRVQLFPRVVKFPVGIYRIPAKNEIVR